MIIKSRGNAKRFLPSKFPIAKFGKNPANNINNKANSKFSIFIKTNAKKRVNPKFNFTCDLFVRYSMNPQNNVININKNNFL